MQWWIRQRQSWSALPLLRTKPLRRRLPVLLILDATVSYFARMAFSTSSSTITLVAKTRRFAFAAMTRSTFHFMRRSNTFPFAPSTCSRYGPSWMILAIMLPCGSRMASWSWRRPMVRHYNMQRLTLMISMINPLLIQVFWKSVRIIAYQV